MSVRVEDIVQVKLPSELVKKSISVATHITENLVDRRDLHTRDLLERFIDCLMGEIAEQTVIYWLQRNNKYAASAVDKTSDKPDTGHDIWVKSKDQRTVKASIKSSISAQKTPEQILKTFTLATTPSELREINIQVYFWLSLNSTPRVTVPTLRQCGIIAWAGQNDLREFAAYEREERLAPRKKLGELRPMHELLQLLR